VFSNPRLVNNILWDNRAGSWTQQGIAGIGMVGDTTGINRWDVGTADGTGFLAPHNGVMNSNPANPTQGWTQDGTNTVIITPPTTAADNSIGFVSPFDLQLTLSAQRTYFRFRPSAIVSVSLPANAIGDYHIRAGTPAANRGLLKNVPLDPPNANNQQFRTDIDQQVRQGNPSPTLNTPTDAGADQVTNPGTVVLAAAVRPAGEPVAGLTLQALVALSLVGLALRIVTAPRRRRRAYARLRAAARTHNTHGVQH
jgi:hypothetical protein